MKENTLNFYEGCYSERYDREIVKNNFNYMANKNRYNLHKDEDDFYEENQFNISFPKYDW